MNILDLDKSVDLRIQASNWNRIINERALSGPRYYEEPGEILLINNGVVLARFFWL
jgi:hypothetical protein